MSGILPTCRVVADDVGVGQLAYVAPLALRQQVPQRLVVHLHVGRLELIRPPLPLKPLRLLQDLQTQMWCWRLCLLSFSSEAPLLCSTSKHVALVLFITSQKRSDIEAVPVLSDDNSSFSR